MELDLQYYRGREQSYIKHLFLKQYLQAAAFKTLQGKSLIFNFVDAFAGPWNVSDKSNYSDTSFHQALQTLEPVRAFLGMKGIAGLKINFCFCEADKKAFEKLREFAKEQNRFHIHVFHGKFECQLDEISEICRDGFTFTFIDPTGWGINSTPIFDFLKQRNGEFLLNFMSEHINRFAGYSLVEESFGRLFADPNWSVEFDKLPNNLNNEEKALFLLRKNLKSYGVAKYLPDFPIYKPKENRVKMRLILGTNSYKGLEVFRHVQFKTEQREIGIRNEQRNKRSNQLCLFPEDQIIELEQKTIGVGCPSNRDKAVKRILDLLKYQHSIQFENLAIDVLENVPIQMTQLNSLVIELKKKNTICFELPPRKRVPRANTIIKLVC